MALTVESSSDLSLNSFDTALCIIPPALHIRDINRLRTLYDKAYEKWPPHVNLIYPFVNPGSLPHAVDLVRSVLLENKVQPFQFDLEEVGFFEHKNHCTIYATNSDQGCDEVITLQRKILSALGQAETQFQPHLTLGQSSAKTGSEFEYLFSKCSLIPRMEWEVSDIVILIREKTSNHMGEWGHLSLSGEYPLNMANVRPSESIRTKSQSNTPESAFQFVSETSGETSAYWKRIESTSFSNEAKQTQPSLSISTYNVLADIENPLSTERISIILESILQSSSTTDVLVLQEVSDNFLGLLLQNDKIRSQYPFCSHGPPTQRDIWPLPSLQNIVVLSRWRFQWEWLDFTEAHKGSVVLRLQDVGVASLNEFYPLVVAGVHLTCGLSDTSISAKRGQIQTLIEHLQTHYPQNNWVIAGDFNIPSSTYTINAALKSNSITTKGAAILSSLEALLAESKCTDCYFESRATGSELDGAIGIYKDDLRSVYEGEEGATYDPIENSLAAHNSGKSCHSRPQRYDRIYIRGEGFHVSSFNLFGRPNKMEAPLGSDHWGVRATLEFRDLATTNDPGEHIVPMSFKKAPPNLGNDTLFDNTLLDLKMFPSDTEYAHRRQMFELVKSAVQQPNANFASETRLNIPFIVVPVGSYGLGVWDTSSDIDCLVIGMISPRTFISLTIQKLRHPEWQEIKILRKVKAASGTMLELRAGGVRFDLQYCVATQVAESWPQALTLPSADPIFDLPMQSLLKLNSLRDLKYLQRTIPDLATFRKAYRFIKAWAKCRGVYASKLGYLGGFSITLLLARVCKLSFRETGAFSTSDIIATFFSYYANFDWKNEMVYDVTFFKTKPKYYRSPKEPMVILSIHPPKVNVARASTVFSVNTLRDEFKQAAHLLSESGSTWKEIAGPQSAFQFLRTYPSYVKINIHYWAKAAAKGRALLGWLEFRCVSLLVDISRQFPDLHARIWPARFTEMEDDGLESMEEYQGCLLIGLSKSDKISTELVNESDRRSVQISLVSLLQNFAEQIRADETYYDKSYSWIDVSLAAPKELRNLRLDTSDWLQSAKDEVDDFLSDDDVDWSHDDPSIIQTSGDTDRARYLQPAPALQVAGGPRLRPAADVINRLRWDASFDSSDYVVGYIDRFVGEKEVPIDQWKSEQTHDDFIPMHRVSYFKRKSDGERIWDREKRIDLIFNTGATSRSA